MVELVLGLLELATMVEVVLGLLELATMVELVLGLLVSGLLWVCSYRALCLINSRCSAEWNCRLVTAAHGVLITCLSYKNGFIDNRWPFTDPGLPNTEYEVQIIVLCLGYFMFDFSWCVYHGTEGIVMLTHHCASIFGLTAGKEDSLDHKVRGLIPIPGVCTMGQRGSSCSLIIVQVYLDSLQELVPSDIPLGPREAR
uniref:TLC domain-containing protein n=1 Tax=Branchiostoma floridae TaxID=7739 RepID=C3YHY3_BRAFL|eukprot:XP_002604109.1 hypothetical protein BRAFLDRAFT_71603 [Branchiostoma floridae]